MIDLVLSHGVPKILLSVLIMVMGTSGVAVNGEDTGPRTEASPAQQEFDAGGLFNEIWMLVNDEATGFWDQNFNEVDWEESKKRYRPQAIASNDLESFAGIGCLGRLNGGVDGQDIGLCGDMVYFGYDGPDLSRILAHLLDFSGGE